MHRNDLLNFTDYFSQVSDTSISQGVQQRIWGQVG